MSIKNHLEMVRVKVHSCEGDSSQEFLHEACVVHVLIRDQS